MGTGTAAPPAHVLPRGQASPALDVEPTSQKKSHGAWHGRHEETCVAPDAAEYVPIGHGLQAALPGEL